MRPRVWLEVLGLLSIVAVRNVLGQTEVLVAGGSFTKAGGFAAKNIAQWNGTAWSALGTGIDSPVSALTVFNGQLVAGGVFKTAGGVSVNNIAQWSGTAWSALGTGMNSGVGALTVYNGRLVAGGDFTTAGGISAIRIAQWSGTAWSALGTGMNNYVAALTVFNGRLVAGGQFTTAGGFAANYIAQWSGTAWSALGAGMSGSSVSPYVEALTVFNGRLVAGGWFTTAGGVSANRIAQWSGTAWSALGTGTTGGGSWVYALTVWSDPTPSSPLSTAAILTITAIIVLSGLVIGGGIYLFMKRRRSLQGTEQETLLSRPDVVTNE